MMHFGIISLFPEMLDSLNYGITGRALKQELAKIACWNPRDWVPNAEKLQLESRPLSKLAAESGLREEMARRTGVYTPVHEDSSTISTKQFAFAVEFGKRSNKRLKVDDSPYGGGPGMVMMYEPLHAAIQHAKKQLPVPCRTIFLTPQGQIKKQRELADIARNEQSLLFIAGRYEGIDERVITNDVDEEWSLGDFVLTGGELAAMVYMDAIIRLLPGCLGNEVSAQQDSFMQDGILDYPHYTRPVEIDGLKVPDILISGHAAQIANWRRKQSLGKTWLKRPDLLQLANLSKEDEQLLEEFKLERGKL